MEWNGKGWDGNGQMRKEVYEMTTIKNIGYREKKR